MKKDETANKVSPAMATTVYTSIDTEGDDFQEVNCSIDCNNNNYELTATAVADLFVDRPVVQISQQMQDHYGHLKELEDLEWKDTFFDDEGDDDSIVAVFDFDYDAMESFYTSVGWVALGATLIYTPLFVLQMIGLAPCFLAKNVRWSTRAQHVAITRDGIRFVREKRPSCWGWRCSDQGKHSKTGRFFLKRGIGFPHDVLFRLLECFILRLILPLGPPSPLSFTPMIVPFDKITDCDVEEPAGNTCLCVRNVLSVVNIDTASSGSDGKRELRLAGLEDPYRFKKLVWAMKRMTSQPHQQQLPLNHIPAMPANPCKTTTNTTATTNGDIAGLLREIRNELRTNNEF